MDPGRALADLVEISPQIEAAAVVAGDGEMIESIGVPAARAAVLARTVRELLDAAAASRADGGRVTQLLATLGEGEVYAATGADGRTIVAVVNRRTAPGLLFYDLKRCLAGLDAGSTGGQAAGTQREDRAAEAGPREADTEA